MNFKLTETSISYTVYNWHAGKLISKAPIKFTLYDSNRRNKGADQSNQVRSKTLLCRSEKINRGVGRFDIGQFTLDRFRVDLQIY